MFAGGVADGVVVGLAVGLSSANAGAASERDNRVAEVTNKDRLAVLFVTGTVEKVQGVGREVPSLSPPRRRVPADDGDTGPMKLSRPVSWFLLAFGVWSWVIWITFVKNLWKDGSGLAFNDAGDPTAYFWVHLTLAVLSFVLGTVVGVIGLRGVRALRQTT
ncbi:hypothetical protein GCM10011579_086260 [Streptomyces albiflavescens]|uniref:Uncharacterized protein n=2 Tax=Streptomyces albiflavescens TaxID=1623582 RepID=A0A917YDY5_9ACTN|nr:hypothetical protein GCM10011579_086260 [Streptomyces albiflavescens]